MILVQGYVGQQPIAQDWGKSKQIATTNFRCHSLIVANKSASAFNVQVWDSPDGGTTSAYKNGATPIPLYDITVPAGDVFSLTHSQFFLGMYVGCVTLPGGSTPIAGNDAKITCEGTIWPVSVT